MNKIKIVICKPNEKAFVAEIEDKLEVLQANVEGPIELFCPFSDTAGIICNEEGKFTGLEPNRVVRDEDGNVLDVIFGTMLIVGLPEDSENFGSLSDEQVEKYLKMFENPASPFELLLYLGG